MINIEEFAKDFFQEILNEADAIGQFTEDIFFDKVCSYLVDTGELETADRAFYRGPPNSGVRVDGYGGDPLDSSGILNLIIADFRQSNNVDRLTQTEMNAIFQRLYKFLHLAQDPRWRNSLEETSPAFGLADLIAERWDRITRIRMILISNRELSDRVDGRQADQIDSRDVTYNVWDLGRLHRYANAGQDREEIEIDLKRDFGCVLPLLPAHLSTGEYEAYLAVVPGHTLGSIYDRWGTRLLEQNVRVFLQARGNVNKGIKNTLEYDPSMFFAYNNGITATAEAVITEERDSQLVATGLRNFQIVNGGQTTASIHMAMRNKSDLSKVFVQMKLSVVQPEKTGDVVPKISEYANSQNRVSAADFFSNHPFHVRMEEFSRRLYAPSLDGTFRETKWFYERARGQFNDARSKLTPAQRKKFDLENPRSQLFTKTDMAKFINVWKQKPDKVSQGAQKNFADFAKDIGQEWKKNNTDFGESFFREIAAKAMVFRSTEKLVSAQPWYGGGYRANIVAYSISKLAHEVSKKSHAVNFRSIWIKQSISKGMEKALIHIAKAVHDVLVDTPLGIRNVTEWAKKQACWHRVKELKIGLPEEFFVELLSSKEHEERRQDDRKDQKLLNGIEAQTVVFNAGGQFWKQTLEWGKNKTLLTEKETGILTIASHIPTKIPSERQAQAIVTIFLKLKEEGFHKELP